MHKHITVDVYDVSKHIQREMTLSSTRLSQWLKQGMLRTLILKDEHRRCRQALLDRGSSTRMVEAEDSWTRGAWLSHSAFSLNQVLEPLPASCGGKIGHAVAPQMLRQHGAATGRVRFGLQGLGHCLTQYCGKITSWLVSRPKTPTIGTSSRFGDAHSGT